MKYSQRSLQYEKVYTNRNIAKKIIDSIDNIDDYDLVMDPFAGDGAFSTQLDCCVGYDIQPDHYSIIEKDFFSFEPLKEKTLIITWTPYDKINNYNLLIQIEKHMRYINVDTV